MRSASRHALVTVVDGDGMATVPLEEWLRVGPGVRRSLHVVGVKDGSSGKSLPLSTVPWAARNAWLSRLLIRAGLLNSPWSWNP